AEPGKYPRRRIQTRPTPVAYAIAKPHAAQGNDQAQAGQAIAVQQPEESHAVQQGIQDPQENDQIGGHAKTLCRCAVSHAPPATASAEGFRAAFSASARHQLNGAPSPTWQAIARQMRYTLPPCQLGAYPIVFDTATRSQGLREDSPVYKA